MLADAIRTLYAYDRWATARLLDAAAQLGAGDLVAPAPGEQRSVRDSLVHKIAAERRWLSWWDGSLAPAEAQRLTLDPDDFPDVASVRAAWQELADRMPTFTAGLTDGELARELSTGSWAAPLWQLMLHVATHGTQHRAEIAALLTALGHAPGELDMTVYFASGGQ
jgi:uncharacterized damage-inducible protein DinB